MPNTTTNYNLTKPLETERYDVQVFNNNADIIDAQMKSNADGIANVNSRLDNLNNWTTVEFTLADFTYDENSGVTYLRTEAPSGYEIAEIKGYMVLNKNGTDSSATNICLDMSTSSYSTTLQGGISTVSLSTSVKGFKSTIASDVNLDLGYVESTLNYAAASSNLEWSSSTASMIQTSTRSTPLNSSTMECTSFALKTNVPNSNIKNFYGKLQYRVVPAS